MAETPVSPPSNGVPARRTMPSSRERMDELTRALETKLAQGFEIESQTETEAVLAIKGRRRWFGLAHGAGARYEVTVDERGRASSRRL